MRFPPEIRLLTSAATEFGQFSKQALSGVTAVSKKRFLSLNVATLSIGAYLVSTGGLADFGVPSAGVSVEKHSYDK